jgi:hypothetical protein
MQQQLVRVEILINGKPIEEYLHQGKTYIEARKGSFYSIKITNLTLSRILVVPSVDGLSVMDGQTAEFGGSGYVLGSCQSVEIPGWRLNDNDVARFRFGDLEGGYAAKMGKRQNVGVIGCAVFKEMEWCLNWYPFANPATLTYPSHVVLDNTTNATLNTTINCSASGGKGEGSVCYTANMAATEFGPAQEHKVQSTTFNRAAVNPYEIITIHYNFTSELKKMGIDLKKRPKVFHSPSPFPGSVQGCCQPPPGWVK